MSGDRDTCRVVLDSLESFLDGTLEAREAVEIEGHFAVCPACAAERRLAEAIAAEIASLPLHEPSSDLRRRLERIGVEPAPSSAPRRPWRLAIAAALLAALALPFLWQRPAPTPPEVIAAEREARQALELVTRLTRKAGEGAWREIAPERIVGPAVRTLERAIGGRRGATDEDSEGGIHS